MAKASAGVAMHHFTMDTGGHSCRYVAPWVQDLSRERKATILLSTPTFLRAYTQRVPAEDFASLELVAAGSERLPAAVQDAFEAKFGIRPFQCYGATELGPIVSANIPANRTIGDPALSLREGTVGRPAPGVRVEVRDAVTGERPEPGEQGVLWVTGPHVMLGYLNRPDLTAAVLVDGWYNTGDVVTIDGEGVITIVGRASRFAKVGGELVPFGAVEEVISGIVGSSSSGTPATTARGVPDERTGRRLVVVHTALEQTSEELINRMAEAGLPRLYLPTPNDFHQIETMPLIGLGKVNLPAIERITREASTKRLTQT